MILVDGGVAVGGFLSVIVGNLGVSRHLLAESESGGARRGAGGGLRVRVRVCVGAGGAGGIGSTGFFFFFAATAASSSSFFLDCLEALPALAMALVDSTSLRLRLSSCMSAGSSISSISWQPSACCGGGRLVTRVVRSSGLARTLRAVAASERSLDGVVKTSKRVRMRRRKRILLLL